MGLNILDVVLHSSTHLNIKLMETSCRSSAEEANWHPHLTYVRGGCIGAMQSRSGRKIRHRNSEHHGRTNCKRDAPTAKTARLLRRRMELQLLI
jgi:hypothetical protein